MATLTNTKIKDTYPALLKATDNGELSATEKVITDGVGNASVLKLGTGSASFTSDIEVNGLTIGKGAGDVTQNTAVGFSAVGGTGIGNTGVGYASLLANTTGAGNSALGINSLRYNTSGAWGSAVGYEALKENTTGQGNTALGAVALQDNTIGSYNTAVGYISLANNINGGNNTAIGYSSLGANTASNNTAVGSGALADNTTGGSNVAIGKDSLKDNTTGSSNTSIGTSAITFLNGTDNVAIGQSAGANTTGALPKTAGSQNTYLGAGIRSAAADTTNEIVIGYNAFGNGSNTATYGNSSITAHHFTSGSVNVTGSLNATLATAAQPNITSVGTLSSLAVTGNLTVDTNTLFVDAASNNVGIGTSSPTSVSNYTVVDIKGRSTTNGGMVILSTSDGSGEGRFYCSNSQILIDDSGSTSDIYMKTNSTNNILFGTANTERMRIDSSGNVQVSNGTIYLGDSNKRLTLDGSDIRIWQRSSANIQFLTNDAERMRITSSGNVGIGTSSPNHPLHIISSNNNILRLQSNDATVGNLYMSFADSASNEKAYLGFGSSSNDDFNLWNRENAAIAFATNNAERMRIDSSGNVVVGTTTARGPFRIFKDSGANDEFLSLENSKYSSANSSGETKISFGWLNHIGASIAAYKDGTVNRTGFKIYTEVGFNTSVNTVTFPSAGGIAFNGDTAAANALDDYEEGTWTMGISFGGASVGVTYNLNEGRYTKIGNMVTVTGRLQLSNKGTSTGGARITGLPFSVPNNNGYRAPATVNLNIVSFANQFQAIVQIASSTIVLAEITEAGSFTDLNETNFANNSVIDVQATYFV